MPEGAFSVALPEVAFSGAAVLSLAGLSDALSEAALSGDALSEAALSGDGRSVGAALPAAGAPAPSAALPGGFSSGTGDSFPCAWRSSMLDSVYSSPRSTSSSHSLTRSM